MEKLCMTCEIMLEWFLAKVISVIKGYVMSCCILFKLTLLTHMTLRISIIVMITACLMVRLYISDKLPSVFGHRDCAYDPGSREDRADYCQVINSGYRQVWQLIREWEVCVQWQSYEMRTCPASSLHRVHKVKRTKVSATRKKQVPLFDLYSIIVDAGKLRTKRIVSLSIVVKPLPTDK